MEVSKLSNVTGPGDGGPAPAPSGPSSAKGDKKLIKGQHLMEERVFLNEIMQFMKLRYGALKSDLSGMIETVKKEEFAPLAEAVSLAELSQKAKRLANKYLEEKPPTKVQSRAKKVKPSKPSQEGQAKKVKKV